MRFSDFSIATRLAICAVIPLVAVAVLAWLLLLDKVEAYRSATRIVDATHQIEAISQAVNRLQLERGRAAGFLGSGGKAGGAELKEARDQTDKELSQLPAALDQAVALGVPTELPKRMKDTLSGLSSLRGNMDQLKVPAAQSFAFYTGVVSDLLDVTRRLARSGGEGSIVTRLQAYVNLAVAKELAGQERGWAMASSCRARSRRSFICPLPAFPVLAIFC